MPENIGCREVGERLEHASYEGLSDKWVSATNLKPKYYANGTNVEKDLTIAINWLEKAAAQNDPEGLYALGHCYAGGHGVEKDLKKAEELLKKAISFGSKKALKLYRSLSMANYFS